MAVVNANTLHESDRYRMKSAIQIFDHMFKLGVFSDANIVALGTGGGNPAATPQGMIILIQNYFAAGAPLIQLQEIPEARAAIEAIIELVQFQILGGTMSDTTLIAANQTDYADLRDAILGTAATGLPATDPQNFSSAVLPLSYKGGETYSGNHRGLAANALPPSTLG